MFPGIIDAELGIDRDAKRVVVSGGEIILS